MKSKLLISLLLALVMLVTLTAPTLAGRPASGWMTKDASEQGNGKYILQGTHDNQLKVTVALRNATPNTLYRVIVYWQNGGSGSVSYGSFETNNKGSARHSQVGPLGYPGSGNREWKVEVEAYIGGTWIDRFWGPWDRP